MGLIRFIQDHNRNVHLRDLKNTQRQEYNLKIEKEQQIKTIFCPKCRKTIPFDSNLCPYCSYNLTVVQNQSEQFNTTKFQNFYCAGCGAKLSSDSNFCSKCGKKV
jgi:predicted amidophosphoribosyltransferase